VQDIQQAVADQRPGHRTEAVHHDVAVLLPEPGGLRDQVSAPDHRRVRPVGLVEGVGDDVPTGLRDAPARQQTLTAVIDWSWDLLTGPERAVVRRLQAHADGCTLEAAEEVCAGGEVPPADVAGLLSRLVDRSLVTVTHGADGPRYRLLESVAAYCAGRLAEAGETRPVRERHGRYYAALAARSERYLYGPRPGHWLRRLDAEAANMRGALNGLLRHGDAEPALRLAVSLTWYWFLRGRLGEARRALQTALAAAGPASPALRARAAAWQAGLEILLGATPDPAAVLACEQLDGSWPTPRPTPGTLRPSTSA
jgi:hypothetical protein